MRDAPKDGRTRRQNARTQPIRDREVFNNPAVVPEAWYPVCPEAQLPVGTATSVLIGQQRIAVWRGTDGKVRAVDAFCPHMGADLANGRVVGNELECYFHQWRYDGTGCMTGTRTGVQTPSGVKTRAWPAATAYGFVWAYSAPVAPYPVPTCAGLEGGEVVSWHLGRRRLYAHHHAMMAGGIDVQHFASVHDLDIEFELDIERKGATIADWHLGGAIPSKGWRARAGRLLLGDRFGYTARFAGGSIVGLTYGPQQRFRGKGRPLPPLHILWGCTPLDNGVSDVDIFLLTKKRPGVRGWLRSRALLAFTMALLGVLRDDDVKAFPFMRFHPHKLAPIDKSVVEFIKYVDGLPKSEWGSE